jgi:dTDP-4-amino-4,6-dideoxygalactose transaminase
MTAVLTQVVSAERPFARSRWPFHDDDEVDAVVKVLRSGRVNSFAHGDACRAFEAACAHRFGGRHGIAMTNGTATLEVALEALGIGPGDEVIVSPRSFMASASSVVRVGARPVFADIDADSQAISVAGIEAALTDRTRAIMPVHLAGWPADMPAIMDLARRHGLKVVEDCAQAHGASIAGQPVGSFGDAASFSFCTDKILSTGGEGGMLLVRDPDVHARAWSLKDHGKRLEPPQPAGTAFRWLHDSFGTNMRMTEMQAAIGLRQLDKLDSWLAARRANAEAAHAELKGLPALRIPMPPKGTGHAWYRFTAFVRPDRLRDGESRDTILAAAHAVGLPVFSGSCPELYREKAFQRFGSHERLPVARHLGETSLVLQVDQTLPPAELRRTAARLGNIISDASQ